jgi:Spy/CpxP family protein refolding chaperone
MHEYEYGCPAPNAGSLAENGNESALQTSAGQRPVRVKCIRDGCLRPECNGRGITDIIIIWRKSMKKTLIVAIAALAACAQKPVTSTAPAPAQTSVASGGGQDAGAMDGRRGGMRGEGRQRMDAMLFNGITLTADQQSRIDSIRARHRADAQNLDPRNNPGDRQKMMQSMEAQMSEVRAVLTADQQTVFDQNVQQMRDRRAQRGADAPPRD